MVEKVKIGNATLYCGDCLEVMRTLPENSVDSIVNDPPYGLEFMGKDWDHGVPGIPFWKEAIRVAKPGAFLLAFGGTRTFHRLACAIEDAGWEIRDTIMWVYGSGFPKSLDVSKAIDKMMGVERRVIGFKKDISHLERGDSNIEKQIDKTSNSMFSIYGKPNLETVPATPEAIQWSGWGTALKPAWEPIIVARKPIEGTVAQNVLKWGTGGINIDGCRVEVDGDDPNKRRATGDNGGADSIFGVGNIKRPATLIASRFPANLIHDGSEEVLGLFPKSSITGNRKIKNRIQQEAVSTPFTRSQDAPEYTDFGSAARFFYCAKASKKERDVGLEGMEAKEIGHNRFDTCAICGGYILQNPDRPSACRCKHPIRKHNTIKGNFHPTVKPLALMKYLIKLITPPNGIILDPFMGSGSTGKAAILEEFNFIGIEIDKNYVEIAVKRLRQEVFNFRDKI